MKNSAKVFLTDYASYNNGTQFEFGHWVDLSEFSSGADVMEYVYNHLEECDEKSPLDEYGTKREEPMFTDFENFPKDLYGESMGEDDFQKIYDLIEYLEERGVDSLENEGDNLLSIWNEYCSENNPDDEVFNFDDDALQMMFGDDPMKAFQAGVNASINWSDDYLYFDGYANIHSTHDPSTRIDETILIDWILENL